MNAAPYCVGLCLFYLPLLSVLGMSSINLLPYLIFTYRSTRSISAPPLIICRVPPVSGSVRIVITVCYQLSFTLCSSLVIRSGESHDTDGLVATARTHLFVPCPQGVSPSTYSLQLYCSSFVSHLAAGRFSIIWIIICSSWWIITSLSAGMFIEFPLQLFVMDNNVRDCILLPSFLSLLSCRIQLVFVPADVKAMQLVIYMNLFQIQSQIFWRSEAYILYNTMNLISFLSYCMTCEAPSS